MPNKVMCTVNNCHYWGQGNSCQASEILVTSDAFANYAPDTVDATTANSLTGTPASVCVETACKTFVPKGAPQATRQSDHVTKQGTTGTTTS